MLIQVLGTGCSSCKRLLSLTEQAVNELGLTHQVEYVTDMVKIAESGIMRTPGLIINGKIVSSGLIPTVETIKNLIQEASSL